MKPIYLDYNATTPIDPRVAEAMLPWLHEHFGNPSSGHVFGAAARAGVDHARGQVAGLLGCRESEIVFTSGGTESNNHAIKGVARARRGHVITSSVEHPAVTEVCRWLEGEGCRVTTLPVDEHGLVDPAAVEAAIRPETALVSVMLANNEVGTIEPIRAIADIAHARDVPVHTDAAQAVGKIPVRVGELGVDLLSVAGHKLYAPKGIGALYIREGLEAAKQIHGADHESNRRAGTENVLEIVGLGAACEIAAAEVDDEGPRLAALRDRLETGLREKGCAPHLNGHPELRLPNTSSLGFAGVTADAILKALPGVAASAGAACHSDGVTLSAVLEAMRVPVDFAAGTIRFSVGRPTTESEIDRAVELIAVAVSAAPDAC